MEFYNRDLKAVAYSKSLLTEGDTMVFISYPSKVWTYDSLGFQRAKYRTVKSENLLKTGSTVFTRLLSDTVQTRIRKQKGYTEDGDLPNGIKYIIDLTPPNEGDEAVELISELSCSIGLRQWYSAETRCKVSRNLVGGDDEVYRPPVTSPFQPKALNVTSSELSKALGSERASNTKPKPSFEDPPPTKPKPVDIIFNQALEKSEKEYLKKNMSNTSFSSQTSLPLITKETKDKEVPEYCPIRHRVGIETLLQCIEGNDPGLDSAPKVWTLFVLAKYFDCARVVLDHIITWMIVEPNCQILEILPESCLKIGVGLQNPAITRAAFGILVSEEALSIESRAQGKHDADARHTNQFYRPKEFIDEDWLNCIQHASQDFHDRITAVAEDLLDERMLWFQGLPEYQKICHFEDHNISTRPILEYHKRLWAIQNLVTKLRHYVRGRIAKCLISDLSFPFIQAADKRRAAENHGPYQHNFSTIWDSLTGEERIMTGFFWKSLRDMTWDTNLTNPNAPEHPMSSEELDGLPFNIKSSYIGVTMTEILDASITLNLSIFMALSEKKAPADLQILLESNKTQAPNPSSSPIDDDLKLKHITRTYSSLYDPDHAYHQAKLAALKKASIPDPRSLRTSDEDALSISDEDEHEKRSSPIDIPIRQKPQKINARQDMPCKDSINTAWPHSEDKPTTSSTYLRDNLLPFPISSPLQKAIPISSGQRTSQHTVANTCTPPVPSEITQSSPYFSVDRFMDQVTAHLHSLCDAMLRNTAPDFDFSTLTDTLLCLDDREFKYLPLWAGGNEDGTGGVFDDLLPVAEAGPSGPGPAFHTGLSLDSASREGSVVEGNNKDGRSINTSLGVEDGFTDTLDRRRVYSLSSTSSSEFLTPSEDDSDSDDYTLIGGKCVTGKKEYKRWKGKGVDRGGASSVSDSESSFDALGDIAFSDTIESDDRTEVGDVPTVNDGKGKNSHDVPVEDAIMVASEDSATDVIGRKSSDFEDDENFWNESDDGSLFGDDDSDGNEDTEMIDAGLDDKSDNDMKDK
ncbi:hypothetical protein B7463_g11839, partial [Scytalidium lignicola]